MSRLLEALHSGRRDRLDELLADDPELDVFEAAALGRTDRLRDLVAQDPSRANAYGDDGFQPLTLACFYGHLDAARVLLNAGADPSTLGRNPYIQTNALHAAAASENKDEATRFELCKLLLDRGADPAIPQGTDAFTALDAAHQNGDERLERLLRDRGRIR
jgi:ankyrin repeat protein